jgi:hypothetical protein
METPKCTVETSKIPRIFISRFFQGFLKQVFGGFLGILTLKNKGTLSNFKKRFRRFQKACKCVETSKKKKKKFTKP